MRHKDFWIALSFGALAGAIAALLYAPQSGRKTRKQLKRSLSDAGGSLEEAGDYLKEQADKLAREASRLIDLGKNQWTDAIDSASAAADSAVTATRKLM